MRARATGNATRLEAERATRLRVGSADVDVDVWYWPTLGLEPERLASLTRILSAEEHVRLAAFHHAADRRDFAAVHALVRTALSTHADVAPRDWMFTSPPGRKPRILARCGWAGLYFNLSHTNGFVACAIARMPTIGVDVERIDRFVDVDEIASHCLSDDERREIAPLDAAARRVRFIEHWTLKEALVKATGEGLSGRLRSMSFELSVPGAVGFRSGRPDDLEWRLALFAPEAMVRLAVAFRSPHAVTIAAHAADSDYALPIPPLRTT